MKKFIFVLSLSAALVIQGQNIRSIASGPWTSASTWDLGRIPTDNDDILIEPGHTVTIDGTPDVTLDAATLIIDGVLEMADDGLLGQANLTFTGYSGMLLRGQILDNVSDFIPAVNPNEAISTIEVDGDIVWSACDGDGSTDFVCFTEYSVLYALKDPDPDNYTTMSGSGSPRLMPEENNPLPVVLSHFEVAQSDSGVLLKWGTSSELNNDHFVVERSEDGKNFYGIGVRLGQGTTVVPQSYEFHDQQMKSSISYYRLKQVDHDGATEFHGPVVARINEKIEKSSVISPNPVQASGTVSWASDEIPQRVRVVHSSGGMNWDLTNEVRQRGGVVEMTMPYLSKGVYMVILDWPNGRVETRKLAVR